MALKNILQETPDELSGRSIQQIIAWAGDGQLRDASATAIEFREYIELLPASQLAQYARNVSTAHSMNPASRSRI
jgi:hypothetical protein